MTVSSARPQWRRLGLSLGLAAISSWLPLAAAQTDDATIPQQPATGRSLSAELVQQIDDYQILLESLQREFGSDDIRLIEPLEMLSSAYMRAGNHTAAQDHLQQQLQILRMSLGLYHADQIPVLESLLQLHAVRRDWGALQDGISHLGWLYPRSELPVETQLAGLRQLRSWTLLLLSQDLREREAIHLIRYRDLSQQMLDLASRHYGESASETMPWLFERANADVAMATTIMHNPLTGQDLLARIEGIREQPLRPGQSITSVADIETVYGARANTVYERSFRTYMMQHFQAVSTLRDHYQAQDNKEAEGLMLLYMGDSVLIRQQLEERPGTAAGPRRGRSSAGTALRYYDEAWQLLLESGLDADLLHSRLGCPQIVPVTDLFTRLEQLPVCPEADADGHIRLPDTPLLDRNLPSLSAAPLLRDVPVNVAAMGGVDLQFSIGVNGQASRIQLLEDTDAEADDSIRNSARRLLPDVQFRPALSDGSVQRSDNVIMRVLLPQRQP